MRIEAISANDYEQQLPEDRRQVIAQLRKIILKNLPKGFVEIINYGMIGYVVPKSIYAAGYHCKPQEPLPFMSIASQKNFIAVYHIGLYADNQLLQWFTTEYTKRCKTKLDMGKSCIRFKIIQDIPYDLIGELASKMTVTQWIDKYELQIKR